MNEERKSPKRQRFFPQKVSRQRHQTKASTGQVAAYRARKLVGKKK